MPGAVRAVAVVAVVTAAVGADAACSSDEGGSPAAPRDAGVAGTAPIVIGVDIALTGNLGPFGQAQQNGTKVAENLVNSLGGVLGRPVKFTIVDDATDTTQSKKNFQSFVDQLLPLVIGPTGSPQSVPLQELAAQHKVVLVSPSASTPDTHDKEPARNRFFFRTAASHALQAKALAVRVFKGFTEIVGPQDGGPTGSGMCARPAVVHADDAYGNPIAKGIADKIAELGGRVAADVKVPTTAKASYEAEVAAVVASKPDCQIVVAFPDVGVGYMRSFRKVVASDKSRDWSTFISVGSNGLASTSFLTLGRDDQANPDSPTVGEGMFIMNLDLNPDIPPYREFKNIFVAQFPLGPDKTELDGYTANQFDAAILACLAIQKAGTATDAIKIRDALFDVSSPPGTAFSPAHVAQALHALRLGQDIDYDGASGPVDFDDYGEVLASYVVYRVKNGKLVGQPSDTVRVDDLK
jgi:ABC-type branched-subunit amino acid transport system substrate-binding protein